MNMYVRKKIKFWTIVLFVYFATITGISFFSNNGLTKTWELRKLKKQLTEQLLTIEAQNVKLAKDIKDLRSYPSFLIEKEAREQLGLAREGEVIYRFGSPSM